LNEQLKYYKQKIVLKFKRSSQFFRMKVYRVKNKKFQIIMKNNRKFLKGVDTFLTTKQYSNGDYGIPIKLFEHIDKPFNNYPTYSDLLVFMSDYFNRNDFNYLEIGVSVMKNYFQLANQLNNINLTGFDINTINPNFIDLFERESEHLFTANYQSNNLSYFQGDLLKKNHTEKFLENGMKYNLIFSDALHTKQGVMAEYENLIKKSLADNFILYFDDLDFPDLLDVSKEIYNDLQHRYNNLEFFTFDINGWVGHHEKFHKNGFITNTNIGNYLITENIRLSKFKKIL